METSTKMNDKGSTMTHMETSTEYKRGRGRPKGSKNKPKPGSV